MRIRGVFLNTLYLRCRAKEQTVLRTDTFRTVISLLHPSIGISGHMECIRARIANKKQFFPRKSKNTRDIKFWQTASIGTIFDARKLRFFVNSTVHKVLYPPTHWQIPYHTDHQNPQKWFLINAVCYLVCSKQRWPLENFYWKSTIGPNRIRTLWSSQLSIESFIIGNRTPKKTAH